MISHLHNSSCKSLEPGATPQWAPRQWQEACCRESHRAATHESPLNYWEEQVMYKLYSLKVLNCEGILIILDKECFFPGILGLILVLSNCQQVHLSPLVFKSFRSCGRISAWLTFSRVIRTWPIQCIFISGSSNITHSNFLYKQIMISFKMEMGK